MTVSINGVTLPTNPPVVNNGNYVFVPYAESVENGLDETITAGLAYATWTYSVMEASVYAWWVTTLMAGAFFLRGPAVLLNDKDVEITFTSVVVRYPTYNKRENGLYYDVTIKIESMVPA